MIQLVGLGRQIELVVGIASFLQRNPFGHRNTEGFHCFHLARVVGHQFERLDLKLLEHIGADGVVAHIGRETKGHVGFHGIGPLILQVIGGSC